MIAYRYVRSIIVKDVSSSSYNSSGYMYDMYDMIPT